jgi:hypothetical protein
MEVPDGHEFENRNELGLGRIEPGFGLVLVVCFKRSLTVPGHGSLQARTFVQRARRFRFRMLPKPTPGGRPLGLLVPVMQLASRGAAQTL